MHLLVDLNTQRVTFGSAPGAVSGEEVKIRQTEDVRLQFHRSGVPELIDTDDDLYIGLKATRASSTTLAEQGTWTHPETSAGYYTCALSTNTDNVIALFTAAPSSEKIGCILELTRTPSGGDTRRYDDAFLTLVRSVFDGTETTPSPGPNRVVLVLNEDENAFEAFVNGISVGYLHLVGNPPQPE